MTPVMTKKCSSRRYVKKKKCSSGRYAKKKKKCSSGRYAKKKKCSSRRCVNFDIISEILLRLPHKALARAKSVCKSWNSLIRNPQFSQTYRQSNDHNNPPHFLIFDIMPTTINLYRIDCDRFTLTKSAVTMPECYNRVVSSSGGLVCIHGGKSLAVFNPTTNELFPLPDLPHSLFAFFVSLEDDSYEHDYHWDKRYLNVISFGYHPPTNQYKVVQLFRDPAGRVARCYMLSVFMRSSACCWRAIEESLMCQVRIDMPGWCIDGVIYWENFTCVGKNVEIISLDLGSEKLKLIQSPWRCESNYPSPPTRHLVELENKLCFVKTEYNNSYNGEQLHMDIWMLVKGDDVGDLKSWVHMHKLELGPSPHVPPFIACFPLCVDQYNNRILLFDQGNYEELSMYTYHLNDKVFKTYDDCELYGYDEQPISWKMARYYRSVIHTEASLVSLD